MHVAVLGAGSLGSLLGGLLAREHGVTLVGREPHVGAVREDGLQIDGAVEAHVRPHATTSVAGLDADVGVVAVKAYDTEDVARSLPEASFDAVLSVQNGLGSEETLAEWFDGPVLAGTATYGADLVEPGRVTCTGIGSVTLGPRDGGRSKPADAVGEVLSAGGVETEVVTDVPRRLWTKLVVNAGINPVTALTGLENGALRSGPAGAVARTAAREAARVATACGIGLSPSSAVDALESVLESTAANRSSMLQDVEAGRPTEIDAINGAVVDRAEAAGVEVPANRALTGFVRRWEENRGLRPAADD